MTLREVLDLMDHEVWVRVRVHDASEKTRDLVLWSADWIGGGEDDPGVPDGLKAVLDWDGNDLSIEMRNDLERTGFIIIPMLVVNAYCPVPKGPEQEYADAAGYGDEPGDDLLEEECL